MLVLVLERFVLFNVDDDVVVVAVVDVDDNPIG